MATNYRFTYQEDAERFQELNGGISNQYFVDSKGKLRDVYWPNRNEIVKINRVVLRSLSVGYKLNKSQKYLLTELKQQ